MALLAAKHRSGGSPNRGSMGDSPATRQAIAAVRSRWTVLALVGAAGTLVAVHALLPLASPPVASETVTVARYGAYLAVFCVWMAWFVVAGVRYLREPE